MKYRCVECGEIVDETELVMHIELYHYDEIILENYEPVEDEVV